MRVSSSRPAFLPDPNDGSLYSLGGKNSEGLTVRGNHAITKLISCLVPFSLEKKML